MMMRGRLGALGTLGGVAAVTAALASCFDSAGPDYRGPALCTLPANGRSAVSCALVMGTVVDANGHPMDGVSGSVRFAASCDCLSPVITVDADGIFSAMVHRARPVEGGSDTTTATVVLFASDTKYPRHHSGGMYFDTARVALSFVPIGAPPVPATTTLRIPLPLGGS